MWLLSSLVMLIVLALGLATVNAAPLTAAAEELSELQLLGFHAINNTVGLSRKAVGPINIDRILDDNIDGIRSGLSPFDPSKLIDQSYYWTKRMFAKLFDGQVKHVSTVYRTGICTLNYSNKIVTANLNMGWDIMSQFHYPYYYDVFLWRGRGTVYGTLSNLKVQLDIDINFSKYQIVLRRFKFHDNGYVSS
uniref:Uncharacterized protein n=1 Tax=Trichogramma kaykai TaxID=54128 RepID=A0ABD2WTL5_9HYME